MLLPRRLIETTTNSLKIISKPAEIITGNFSNTSVVRYGYTSYWQMDVKEYGTGIRREHVICR
jgi:hypothetical protein